MAIKNSPTVITVQQYTEGLALDLTKQIMDLVNRYETKVGKGTGIRFVSAFLKNFIGGTALTVLSRELDQDEPTEEDVQSTMKEFGGFKSDVQDAIATGFGDAMFQFSGRNMDYYCQITPVPEPINDKPC